MKKKIFFLFLALILPGIVFVFLKKFGRNEFVIPIYFQHNTDSLNSLCGTHYSEPYQLPDSVLEKTGWHSGRPSIFVTDSIVNSNSEFKRLAGNFDARDFQVIGINATKYGEAAFQRWSACVLMVKAPYNVVLVDTEKRIRGYYSIGSREETDRLIVELEILLKKY